MYTKSVKEASAEKAGAVVVLAVTSGMTHRASTTLKTRKSLSSQERGNVQANLGIEIEIALLDVTLAMIDKVRVHLEANLLKPSS